MNYSSIKELISIINDSELTTFEMEFEGIVLKMKKGEISDLSDSNLTKKITKSSNTTKNLEKVQEVEVDQDEQEEVSGEMIKAPLVGTFYSSAGTGKENFVKVGDTVKKGDVVCILEAMKIMNEIQSPKDGKIVKILAESEQMVEYGQPLFIIE
jgi:acetyl-CoA carboxylase biotin carboxyl carrier protein